MSKKKNHYEKKAKMKHFMAAFQDGLPTKGDAKNSFLETGKDILVGVLGGGLISAAIGRPSLLVGIITTGVGHYTDNKLVQLMGVGMMASNGFQKSGSTAVSGLEGLDGIKERMQVYKETMSERLYLDKIIKKKQAGGTNGVGELQFFSYPNNDMNSGMGALNDIEEQIAESARQFQGQLASGMAGSEEYEMGELAGHIY